MTNQVIEFAVLPSLELRLVYAFVGSIQFHDDKKSPLFGALVGFALAAPGLLAFVAINAFGRSDSVYENAFLSRGERVAYSTLSLAFVAIMGFLG